MKRKTCLLLFLSVLNVTATYATIALYKSPSGSSRKGSGYLFTFAHITDSHFDGSSSAVEGIFSWLTQQDDISFLVHTGDIVSGPFNEQSWKKAYEHMHRFDRNFEWGILAGDDDLLYGGRINFANYEKYFGNESRDQCFIVGSRLLFILFGWDTDGSISHERLEWMDETIEKNENLSVVICLHPYIYSSFLTKFAPENPTVPNAEEVWSHIDKHENIVMTLSGHVHRNWVQIHLKGTHKVWCTSTEALYERGYVRLFDVYDDRIEVYAYSSTGEQYLGPLDRFTVDLHSGSFDVDKDLWDDSVDFMPTHPLVPDGILLSTLVMLAILFARLTDRKRICRTQRRLRNQQANLTQIGQNDRPVKTS